MITEEIKELEEMFKHGRFHLEEDLADSPNDTELADLVNAFKRIDVAIQDKRNHQLILDLFFAVSYLDLNNYDCDEDEEYENDEIDE